MNYTHYPKSDRFAVTIHQASNNLVPLGWPDAVQPLADGEKPPAGYKEMIGEELNDLRDSLAHHWPNVHENIRQHRLECRKAELLHEHTIAAAALQAVISGKASEAVAAASSHEELQALTHALNSVRK